MTLRIGGMLRYFILKQTPSLPQIRRHDLHLPTNYLIKCGMKISTATILLTIIILIPNIVFAQVNEGEWAIETLTPDEPIPSEQFAVIYRNNDSLILSLPLNELKFVLREKSNNSYKSHTFHNIYKRVSLRLKMNSKTFEASLVYQKRHFNDLSGNYESKFLGHYGYPPSVPKHCFVGEWEAEHWDLEMFNRRGNLDTYQVIIRDHPDGPIFSIPKKGIEFKAALLRHNKLSTVSHPPGTTIDIKFSKDTFAGEINYPGSFTSYKIKGQRPKGYAPPETANPLSVDDELSPTDLSDSDKSISLSESALRVLRNLELLRAKIKGEPYELSVDTGEETLEELDDSEISTLSIKYTEKCE